MALDTIIVQFVTDNYLSLTMAFTVLKGVAKITPWAWDDSLMSLVAGLVPSLRKANTK